VLFRSLQPVRAAEIADDCDFGERFDFVEGGKNAEAELSLGAYSGKIKNGRERLRS
jgi:hypothetical protein